MHIKFPERLTHQSLSTRSVQFRVNGVLRHAPTNHPTEIKRSVRRKMPALSPFDHPSQLAFENTVQLRKKQQNAQTGKLEKHNTLERSTQTLTINCIAKKDAVKEKIIGEAMNQLKSIKHTITIIYTSGNASEDNTNGNASIHNWKPIQST